MNCERKRKTMDRECLTNDLGGVQRMLVIFNEAAAVFFIPKTARRGKFDKLPSVGVPFGTACVARFAQAFKVFVWHVPGRKSPFWIPQMMDVQRFVVSVACLAFEACTQKDFQSLCLPTRAFKLLGIAVHIDCLALLNIKMQAAKYRALTLTITTATNCLQVPYGYE